MDLLVKKSVMTLKVTVIIFALAMLSSCSDAAQNLVSGSAIPSHNSSDYICNIENCYDNSHNHCNAPNCNIYNCKGNHNHNGNGKHCCKK